MIRTAHVIIHGSKAYVPTIAQTDTGLFLEIAPVYVAHLIVDDITDALHQAMATGHPPITHPAPGEWKQRKDPMLPATKARSWKALAKKGGAYTLEWTNDAIVLYYSEVDKKGRFASGIGKTQRFPRDSDIELVVAAILEDVRTHPEWSSPL